MNDSAEQLKPLADRLEARAKKIAANEIADAMRNARASAFSAYQAALKPLCGQRFGVVVDAALKDAEDAIAAAVLPLAERKALDDIVARVTGEAA